MSWSDPCSKCGEHRADCECGKVKNTKNVYTYTEQEVRRLVSKAWLIHPNPENMLEEFDQWFEKNKKNSL